MRRAKHARRVRATLYVVPDGYEVRERDDNVLLLVPLVPEAETPLIREGLARRRMLLLEGRCACGAEAPPTPPAWLRARGGPVLCYPDHTPYCAAIAEPVLAWVRARLGDAA